MTIQPYHEQPQFPAATDSWVPILTAIGDLAQKLAATQFVPRAMQRQPASIAAAILTGREMGLGPMAALRGIDVIEGRPALTAQMLAARILTAGHRIEWVTADDKRCTVRIERGDGLSTAEATWTLADAQRAGLAGKKVWQQYPRHMLRARALSECASMACPDVALGLDVLEQPTEQTRDAPTSMSVVQIHTEAAQDDNQERVSQEASAVEAPRLAEPTTPSNQDDVALVTPTQIRKLNAQISELERIDGHRLTREQRRELIAGMAGVQQLASAKDLTVEEASKAIDMLDKAIGDRIEADSTDDDGQPA